MTRWSAAFILLLTGCPAQDQFTTDGLELWEHFPFDGTRSWEYISTNLELDYKLQGDMRPDDPDPEVSEDYNIYHIDFTQNCVNPDSGCVDGQLVRTLGFSSDITNGTLIHTFNQGSVNIEFDPPLVVAPKEFDTVGQTEDTSTDGITWSSTLVGFEPCSNVIAMQGSDFEKSNCSAHLTLSDNDNFPDTNYGLAGDYWVAKGLGIVGISLEGDDGEIWGLSKMDCEPLEECNGQW